MAEIDPNIALSGRPPADPVQTIGNAVSVVGGLQNQQAQRQQMDLVARQMKNQDALTKAMLGLDPSKPESLNRLPSAVIQAGGDGNTAIMAQQHVYQMRQTAATLSEAESKAAQQKNDALHGALSAFDDVPNEKLAEAVTGAIPDLVQRGLLDPQHAQALGAGAANMDPVALKAQINFQKKLLTTQTMVLKEREVKAAEDRAANTGGAEGQAYRDARKIAMGNSGATVAGVPPPSVVPAGAATQGGAPPAAPPAPTGPVNLGSLLDPTAALAQAHAQDALASQPGVTPAGSPPAQPAAPAAIPAQAPAAVVPPQSGAGTQFDPMAALARVKNAARPPQESLDLVARVLGPAASADRWASGIRFLNAQGVDNATLTNLGVPAQFSADAQATVKGLAKPANEAQGVDAQAARAWLARPENKGKDMADFLKYEKGITPAINNYIQMHPGGAEGAAPKAADGTALAGADLLKSFGATGGTVKAVAEGRQDPPKGMALKSPYWAKVMQQVYQYDPDWSEQRAQIRKAFTTGPDGRNIGALNTATAHLDQLVEASKALNNGTWQPGNKVYNYFAGQFGSAKITNREFVMNALAGETASALKGNATDPEIAHVMKTLSADFSPDQAEGIGETGLHVLGAKLNTYHERYQQQIPGDKVWSPVLPTAQKVFNKYGISVGDADAGGSAAAAPTQGGAKPGGAALHTIKIGTKTYTYKGSGDTSDLSNYTEKK